MVYEAEIEGTPPPPFEETPTLTPEVATESDTQEDIDPLALYDTNGNGRITCAEAKQHGIVPVHDDYPAFQYMTDADGDGVVCESGYGILLEGVPLWRRFSIWCGCQSGQAMGV